jgi:CubicO group peptidase (beta-lactamase class C family)
MLVDGLFLCRVERHRIFDTIPLNMSVKTFSIRIRHPFRFVLFTTVSAGLLIGCQDDGPGAFATVETSSMSDVTPISATGGGTVVDASGSPVSSRGVVWSTQHNPTADLPTKTDDGTGEGGFVSLLTGLVPGTTYYVRAYATNGMGIAYGEEVTFLANEPFTTLDNALAAKMKELAIPAVSLAIVRNERLVYAQSYGYADKETNQEATNTDRYRIASLSKPITAIAILKLSETGSLSLDDAVFGANGILGNDFGAPPVGSDKDKIMVRHLLNHTSGWINSPDDPMFRAGNLTQAQLISDLLANRPLAYTPGTQDEYLNFGYCVLGRVIEKVTGQSYEAYTKAMLAPMGIADMQIAGNTLEARLPGEVKYYQAEFSPYSMNVARMDSHGGWVASATDLARFMVRIDRGTHVPDIVSSSLQTMYFRDNAWVHAGSLPGTSSLLVRSDNTFSFVVLANTRTEDNYNRILQDLYTIVREQILMRGAWPSYDLFER